ncbi:hypothetical protein BDZ91DRAFT_179863 [Kalaharituber pfeilii]|nr:hypothetical protein BDZ91DRAFT_179863 [Kalaharituber pfeilii]
MAVLVSRAQLVTYFAAYTHNISHHMQHPRIHISIHINLQRASTTTNNTHISYLYLCLLYMSIHPGTLY